MGEKLLALDPKRRRFIEEYRVDWNAKQAAHQGGVQSQDGRSAGVSALKDT